MDSHRLVARVGPILFAIALLLPRVALAQESGGAQSDPPSTQHEVPARLHAGAQATQGQPMESMSQGEMAGGRGNGGLSCTCPKGLMHAGGIALAILAGVALLSGTAALAALAVFLMRRSRQAPAA